MTPEELITREVERNRVGRVRAFRVARLMAAPLFAGFIAFNAWLGLDLIGGLTSQGRWFFALYLFVSASVFGLLAGLASGHKVLRFMIGAVGVWVIGTGLYLIVREFSA